jgi:hypothetical protein
LYYCLLLYENSLPVCDILTTRHTSESIQARLLTCNHSVSVVNANKLVKPKYIVVDFSYALINACVRSFNDESLSRYLRRCHRYLMINSTADVIANTSFIVLCNAHMVKTVLRRVASVEPNAYKRKLILLLFTALMKTHSLLAASTVYNLIHVVLCCRCNSYVVTEAKQQLTALLMGEDDASLLQGYDNEQQQDIDSRNDDDDCTHDDLRTLKEQSPFTEYFRTALTSPVDDDENEPVPDIPDNDWYSPTGFSVITEYVHLYPLWSAALQHEPERLASDFNGDRQCQSVNRSNAAVEAHFRSVKHGRLGGRRSVRPKQFVDAELAYVNGKLNEARLPTRRTAASYQLSDLEETWRPRRTRGSGRRSRVATYSSPATAATVIAAVGRRAGRGRVRGRGRGVPRSLSATSMPPPTPSTCVTLPATTALLPGSDTTTSTAVTISYPMPSASIARQNEGNVIVNNLFIATHTLRCSFIYKRWSKSVN